MPVNVGLGRTVSPALDRRRSEDAAPDMDDLANAMGDMNLAKKAEGQRKQASTQPVGELSQDESHARDEFKKAMDEDRFHEAVQYREKLAKAYRKHKLDKELEELYRLNEEQQKAFRAHVENKEKHTNGNLGTQAEAKRMGESAMERLATLARFDQQALAFMMLTKDIKFIARILWIATGAQLAVGSDYGNFLHLKGINKDLVFDHDDYAYPEGTDPEAIKTRAETEDRLAQRRIYKYEVSPDGKSFTYIGTPVTNPNEITVEMLIANKIVPKPDIMLQLRRETVLFTVEMAGVAGDIIRLLDEYDPSQPANKVSQGPGKSDAEQQAILQRNMARMKV